MYLNNIVQGKKINREKYVWRKIIAFLAFLCTSLTIIPPDLSKDIYKSSNTMILLS